MLAWSGSAWWLLAGISRSTWPGDWPPDDRRNACHSRAEVTHPNDFTPRELRRRDTRWPMTKRTPLFCSLPYGFGVIHLRERYGAYGVVRAVPPASGGCASRPLTARTACAAYGQATEQRQSVITSTLADTQSAWTEPAANRHGWIMKRRTLPEAAHDTQRLVAVYPRNRRPCLLYTSPSPRDS